MPTATKGQMRAARRLAARALTHPLHALAEARMHEAAFDIFDAGRHPAPGGSVTWSQSVQSPSEIDCHVWPR